MRHRRATLATAEPIEERDPFAPFEGRKSLRAATVDGDPRVLRTPLLRPVLISCAWFVPPFALILGLAGWWASQSPAYPGWALGILLGVGIGLAAFLIWFTGVEIVTYGIRLTEDGLWVFERSVKPGIVIQSLMLWPSIRVVGARFGNVEFDGNIPTVGLTYEQARIVLRDPRFPPQRHPSAQLARRIGL